jgi:hypothetical protein
MAVSEDRKRLIERWTLFFGGVEMLIGASMAAFPDVFPGWLTLLALAIAVVTIGVGVTLVWTDITKLAAALHLRPSWIGPIVSAAGLSVMLGLALWYVYQAPKGAFAGSSVGVVLVAAALLILFALFGPKKLDLSRGDQPGARTTETNAGQIEINRANDRVRKLNRALDRMLTVEIERILRRVLDQLIKEQPDYEYDEDISTNNDLMKERTHRLESYIRLVRHNINDTRWGHDLEFLIQSVEAEENHRFEVEPPPPNINAYIYRAYAVAMTKRRRVVGYLKKSLAEAERDEMQHLSPLRVHARELDPKTFGV